MNVFYLHQSPVQSAQWMVDRHVVKMILETAQLLCTAHRLLDGEETTIQVEKDGKVRNKKVWQLPDQRDEHFYSATHRNHPSSVWCRESVSNYNWLVDHFFALGDEYTYRYDKQHKSILKLGYALQSPPINLKTWDWTDPPSCMDDEYIISKSPIENYRNYYVNGKKHLKSYKKGPIPDFWNDPKYSS